MNTIEIVPGTVVVAGVGSAPALRAVQWAATQARLEGRPLTLVHVSVHDAGRPTTLKVVGDGVDQVWLDDTYRASHLILEEASEAARAVAPAVHVHALSLPGEPRKMLKQLSYGAHLLVLGSRGRGVVRSRLLGSVSAGVVKAARCPVVVVRPETPGLLKDGVVVAADATAESRPVVEFAYRQASLHGVPLTVMHCMYDEMAVASAGIAGPYLSPPPDPDEHARLLSESLVGVAEKYPDVHVTREIVRGPVESCLTDHPRPWNLIVVGRHPVRGTRWLTGTTAVEVLEHASTPIAVVPEPTHVG